MSTHSNPSVRSQPVSQLSEASFTQLVNGALRNYQSTLALSRSPLANSSLVTPTLVKDEASPTAEERGNGLRLVLRWAVNQMAPNLPTYPIGEYRPLDDPTWRDPRWWRYNILRHRYLEPLHPDDFVSGGRYTESLIALTGISSPDAFFDERNRAIREIAERLRQQLVEGKANGELQRLALQESLIPLEKSSVAIQILAVASIFEDVFPRNLLKELVRPTITKAFDSTLDDLILRRFLLADDQNASLWFSPSLRNHIYKLQSASVVQNYHRSAAYYFESQGSILLAAQHWQRAKQSTTAAHLLLTSSDELIRELQMRELIVLLQQFDPHDLNNEEWYDIQVLLSDLFYRSGQQEDALVACRNALKTTDESIKQARIYRRMGKLYESRNQQHALRYYQQAIERFPSDDLELAITLKDRGWIYSLRREWDQANDNLLWALSVAPIEAKLLRSDIYDAMASVSRDRQDLRNALIYAEKALSLREEAGDLMRVAKSLGNLGRYYEYIGEYDNGILAHKEAFVTYQKIGNQELMSTALLNIGVVQFLAGQYREAIETNKQSLAICQDIGLPLIEIKAHYNLIEAQIASSDFDEAIHHWRIGLQLCRQYSFDDQEVDFIELGKTLHFVEPTTLSHRQNGISPENEPSSLLGNTPSLDPDDQETLTLAQREPRLTAQRLMAAANISRATATRRLASLVEKGLLQMEGKGRGVYYRLIKPEETTNSRSSAKGTHPSRLTDFKSVSELLNTHQDSLRQGYGIDTIEPAPRSTSARPTLKLTVRFQHLPDLARYFELRQHLSQLLQADVDLVPEIN